MIKPTSIVSVLTMCTAMSIASATTTDIKILDINNGLSDNFVSSICHDANGYMWFATELGANRFDGSKFTSYYKGHINGNELNRVIATESTVYIATQRYGLSVFDCNNETFSSFNHENGAITANDITDLCADSNGNVWISYYWEGFDCLNSTTNIITHYSVDNLRGLGSNQIWTIKADHNLIYIGHVDAGLSVVNIATHEVKNYRYIRNDDNSLPSDQIYAILPDTREGIWLGTDGGLAYFVNGQFTRVSQIKGRVKCMKQMPDGSLWVGVENGGVSVVRTNGIFTSIDDLEIEKLPIEALNNITISDIDVDQYGNTWLATFGSGVYFISNREKAIKQWNRASGELSWRVAWGITSTSDGCIWVGTDGRGFDIFKDGHRIDHLDTSNSHLSDNAILSATTDSDGNIWAGTFQGGLNFCAAGSHSFSRVALTADAVDIRAIVQDSTTMYVASNNGLFCLDRHTHQIKQHITQQNSVLRDNLVRAVAVDSKGYIWIGTFGQGITIINPKDPTQSIAFILNENFISNTIYHIIRDSKNRMWVATGNGVVVFEEGQYENFTQLKINGVIAYGLVEGNNGQIWVSTNKGLSCIDLQNQSISHFDHRDGLPRGIFHGGAVTTGIDGTIYFGSENGVAIVSPNLNNYHIDMPKPHITGFHVYGESAFPETIAATHNIFLEHTDNTFSIEFNVMNYALADVVEFSCKLDGFDERWHTVHQSNEVTYRNVPYGKYTYRVRVRIRNGEWGIEEASLPITIYPPLWLTWWAKLLYIIMFIGLVWLLFNIYNRHLTLSHTLDLEREKNMRQKMLDDERQRFFTNMTHELRTPLTLILGPLEDLKNDTQIPLRQANKIVLIYNSALKLLGLINRLLDFRKTELQKQSLCVKNGNIIRIINEIVTPYKELNRNRDLTYSLHISPSVPQQMLFDADVIQTTVNNLLSNAVKYTKQGSISVSLDTTTTANGQQLKISVADSGIGIPEYALPHIFERFYQVEDSDHHTSGTGIGLALVSNLVKLHSGEIKVDSQVGVGTTFTIYIPIRNEFEGAIRLEDNEDEPKVSAIASETEASSEASESEHKPIMLVVEDNEEILKYIAESFENQFEVCTATNGTEGLNIARKTLPDIIISDIMMPEMDGTEMCQILKSDVTTSHIPIILLTAKNSTEARTDGYQKGADSYLTKPFSASVLQSRVENLIDSRKRIIKAISKASDSNKKAELTESISRIDAEFIEKITSVINDNIESDKIDVSFIGDKVGMSHSTLYRKIKALTGMSANEFIRKVRMHNAEKLLLTGRYTISEVSYMVGINSMAYFRQCFKDEFGLTPSAYIKHIENADNE
ncbi:MAG: response regulator [Bacteroidales bacterium]|nr:response regulator [Bacteroidales bacterium]